MKMAHWISAQGQWK